MSPDILKKHIVSGLKNKYGFCEISFDKKTVIAKSKSGIKVPMGELSQYEISKDFVGNNVLFRKNDKGKTEQVWRFMRIKKTSARKVLEKNQIDFLASRFN